MCVEMAAWKHSEVNDWHAWGTYDAYRKHVAAKAASFRGREEDCADLSMSLLVDFAADNGLTLTFEDNAGRRYISKASGVVIPYTHAQPHVVVASQAWSTKEEYRKWVLNRIGVESLWKRNTEVNRSGPENGDLMIIYKKGAVSVIRRHTALVYRIYAASEKHAKSKDTSIPNFPGEDTAKNQVNVTEYFRGTVNDDGVTVSRDPDGDTHIDYLNHRGTDKPKAELLYYANAAQLRDEGFEFRMYSLKVTDDWYEWDGRGNPPR
jgi:hypothetical protein